MKTKKFLGLMLAVCLISAWVTAEVASEKKTERKGKKADVSVSEERPERGPRGARPHRVAPADRQQAYKQMRAKRVDTHKKSLAELEAIKKIAEQEGATRTAEAIGNLIDKKDSAFKKRTEQFEQQRQERRKRIQQRAAEKSDPPPAH